MRAQGSDAGTGLGCGHRARTWARVAVAEPSRMRRARGAREPAHRRSDGRGREESFRRQHEQLRRRVEAEPLLEKLVVDGAVDEGVVLHPLVQLALPQDAQLEARPEALRR
eukprot:70995-Prymnesium_polylepis.2